MVFSDTTTKQGLIQDCEMLVFSNYGDISGNTSRLYDFTARLNRAYDKLATVIMSVDGRWQFDDTNYTDLPIGQTNLVSGQKDYVLDVEFLDVEKVISTDSSGNKYVMAPFDIHDPAAVEYLTQPTSSGGTPTRYDKAGSVLSVFPTPNYDYTNGLIVHYRRKPSYFAYNDTTKTPGVPAVFHRYLSLDASLDYAVSKQLSQKNDIAALLKDMTETVRGFYSGRSKDEQKFIRPIIRRSN